MGNVDMNANTRSVLVALRFTQLERDALGAAAKARGVTLSDLIRAAVFRDIDQAELPPTQADRE